MAKIIIAGESWTTHTIHQKGFDMFTSTTYEEGVKWLKDALEMGNHEIFYIPNHRVQYDFPKTLEELEEYDVVILSDIGSNTLLLSDDVFMRGKRENNKCEMIRDFVLQGGAFIMIGGYMAFSGIDARSKYGFTAIKDILPVKCLEIDDRVEAPQGLYPEIKVEDSAVFSNMPKEWPHFLGYNKTVIIEKGEVLATINGDPFIVIGSFGSGKSAVFTSDCAPHWGPIEFIEWDYYKVFWNNLVSVLTS